MEKQSIDSPFDSWWGRFNEGAIKGKVSVSLNKSEAQLIWAVGWRHGVYEGCKPASLLHGRIAELESIAAACERLTKAITARTSAADPAAHFNEMMKAHSECVEALKMKSV